MCYEVSTFYNSNTQRIQGVETQQIFPKCSGRSNYALSLTNVGGQEPSQISIIQKRQVVLHQVLFLSGVSIRLPLRHFLRQSLNLNQKSTLGTRSTIRGHTRRILIIRTMRLRRSVTQANSRIHLRSFKGLLRLFRNLLRRLQILRHSTSINTSIRTRRFKVSSRPTTRGRTQVIRLTSTLVSHNT